MRKDICFYLAAYDVDNLKNEFGESSNVTFVKYRFRNKILRLSIDIPWLIVKYKCDYAHFQYMLPLFKNVLFDFSNIWILSIKYHFDKQHV